MSNEPSLDNLWSKLCELARYAPQQLKILLATEQTASSASLDSPALTSVKAKSKVWIDVEIDRPGWLILLDRDATGEIVCLSPSPYVPQPQLDRGIERLPQVTSIDRRVFQPEILGDGMLLAIILPEQPTSLSWLSGEVCLSLNAGHLQELLHEIATTIEPVAVMRSDFQVFADSPVPGFLDFPTSSLAQLATAATQAVVADLHHQGISTYGIRDRVLHETNPEGEIIEVVQITPPVDR
jgi:hypothetical protein